MILGEGSPRIVIAGGGTTGHLSPGLAVADVLRDGGCEVIFIGTARGPEARLVPNAGFRFAQIPVIGRGKGIVSLRNIKAALILARAFARSMVLLGRFRPHVVFGTGGYVSLPVMLAARVRGIPVVIHEQNVVLGMANRISARFARTVCISFAPTPQSLSPNAVVTGNPVRSEILIMDPSVARLDAAKYFDLDPERRTVFVFGGSQGAAKINSTLIRAYPLIRSRADIQLLHVTGSKNLAEVDSSLENNRRPDDLVIWRTVGYTDRMDLAYAIADLAVCRAGASTIAELSTVGLPAVLVPLPGSLDDDQRRNAESVVAIQAAVMIVDSELEPGLVVKTLDELLHDRPRRDQMSLNIKELFRPQAASHVAQQVLAAAKPTA